MNAFLSKINTVNKNVRHRTDLRTLQANMGNLCNQRCAHCHVNAGLDGRNIMKKDTIDDILKFLSKNRDLVLDITGGAPEMNGHFEYFVRSAKPLTSEIIIRTNLTVLFEKGKERLPLFFKENKVHLVASMPCYSRENVDAQRGKGVFEKSVRALSLLNSEGYGKTPDLVLDLAHNPKGAYLSASEERLERDYKKFLKEELDIEFNRLITITNAPINRFRNGLEASDKYDDYMELLENSFNKDVVGNIMCRTLLSVGYDGAVYDCDFNQSLGMALYDKNGDKLNIRSVSMDDLTGRAIIFDNHCFLCTAGSGSSCRGALEERKVTPIKNAVREYYGKTLSTTGDLKTTACCVGEEMPSAVKEAAALIEPEITARFYGCGSPIPHALKGCTVLDLGCGTGRDAYIASYLAGEHGHVIGVDMTDEQIELARKFIHRQTKRFGYSEPNVEFKKGYIEDLEKMGIETGSIDVVISNCVINLSPDKKAVFREIFRVLKPGGELYFSDIFTGRRMPAHLKDDPVMYGECLGGALYIEDFRRLLREIGCPDYRVVSKRKVALDNPELELKAGMIDFYSMTIRAFKLGDLEDICEDYGQTAVYLGTVPVSPHEFKLDDHHLFIKDKPLLVCGNTASMLQNTRYARHFNIMGTRDTHFGPFNCKPTTEAGKVDGCC